MGDGDGFFFRPIDTGIQTVSGVIGDPDRIVSVFVGDDTEDRPEDLILRDGHIIRDIREDRGVDVVAVIGAFRQAAREEHGPFGKAFLDIFADLLVLRHGGHRPELHIVVCRVADRIFFGDGAELFFDEGFLAFRDEQAGEGGAGLAGVQKDTIEAKADRCAVVMVLGWKDHVGRFPAKLKADMLHAFQCSLADGDAARGGSGEGDHGDERMGRERIAHFAAAAGHEVEDAFRKACLFKGIGEEVGGERRVLARL